ncbi:MAG: AAA family ATPase [Magnetococcales bacterium]|nr:AAA family ATPase [Magnetococcales bacterium]
MIIQTVQVENLFKYRELSLVDLADRRRILLSGPNESGKTAIVELLCLGLFGRTTVLEPTQLAKAVKWGAGHGQVAVTFLGSDGLGYTVFRLIDQTGQSQASLCRAGETEPLATGVAAVDQAVVTLAGFDFRHYRETLLLAQNTRDDAASATTLRTLVGVADLEELAKVLQQELAVIQGHIERVDGSIQTVQAQRTTLNVQEPHLGALAREQQEAQVRVTAIAQERERWHVLATGMQQCAGTIEIAAGQLLQCGMACTLEIWQERVNALEEALRAMDTLCQAHQLEMVPGGGWRIGLDDLNRALSQAKTILEQVAEHRHRLLVWLGEVPGPAEAETLQKEEVQRQEAVERYAKQRTRSGKWVLMILALAFLFGGSAGLLRYGEDSFLAQALLAWLKEGYPQWGALHVTGLFLMATSWLLLASNLAARYFRLGREIKGHNRARDGLRARAASAQEMIQGMDQAAQEPLPRQVVALERLTTDEWHDALLQWANTEGLILLEEEAQQTFMAQLRGYGEAFRQEVADYDADLTAQRQASQQEEKGLAETIVQLEKEMAQEQGRRLRDQELRTEEAEWEAEKARHLHQVAVRRVAHELLQGTCQTLSARFNQALCHFMAQVVPLFTQGRYQQVRIDERLQVTAFSRDKQDFVDFDEISTGVRYQLWLAVRLALAQALAARVGCAPQFMVLDEPFVFFDGQRTQESLAALLRVGGPITQIWITAQTYAEGVYGAEDLPIACTCHEETLVVQGG